MKRRGRGKPSDPAVRANRCQRIKGPFNTLFKEVAAFWQRPLWRKKSWLRPRSPPSPRHVPRRGWWPSAPARPSPNGRSWSAPSGRKPDIPPLSPSPKGHIPLRSPPPAPAPGPGGMTLGKVRVLAESGAGFPVRPIAFTEGEGSLSSKKRSAAGQPVTGCPAALLDSLPRATLPLPHRGDPRHAICPSPPCPKGRRQRAAAFWKAREKLPRRPLLIPPAPGKRPPQTPVPGGRGGGFWPRRRRFGW